MHLSLLLYLPGLSCEGIYRISGVKSKVQALKDAYNCGLPVCLFEHEPNVVASLFKQFLREVPEPVLTTELLPQFEQASGSWQCTCNPYGAMTSCVFPPPLKSRGTVFSFQPLFPLLLFSLYPEKLPFRV